MKKSLRLVFIGFALLPVLLLSPDIAGAQGSWPMFRQNMNHTGSSQLNGPLAPDLAWQYNTAGYTYSSPVITDTRVYIASETELIALDHNGNEIWTHAFSQIPNPPAVEISGLISTPAVALDGTIYIGSLDHNLYALNPNGTLKWSFDAGGQILASPTIGPDGTIFIGSRSGQFSAVNPDGTLRWLAFREGEIFSSAALGPNGGAVFVGATDNKLYGYNATNGGSLWTPFQAQGEIISSPAVFNGIIYFGSLDNNLYAVDAATGEAAWNVPFQTGAEIVSSPAVDPDGTVYVGSFDRRLYAVNGLTGAAKWPAPFITGSLIAASPAIDGNGNIFISSLDGSMYVLDDGNTQAIKLWEFPTGSPIWASPAIGPDNNVFVAASGSSIEAGRLFAINEAIYTLTFSTTLVAGQPAPFSVKNTGTETPANGTLFYRSAGATSYIPLDFSGNATIPGTAITGKGFEYYIVGPDGTLPNQSPALKPATQRVFINNDTSPDHFLPRVYRMISVPYDLTSKSIQDVLMDDYQAYGPQSWRLHRWNGSAYDEYPSISKGFEPGMAFFLVTANGNPFNVGSGWSVITSQPYTIGLKPGWNQIGNPFGFPVAWSQVIRNPEVVNAIAFFDGTQMIQDPGQVGLLAPWEGYFVYSSSDEEIAIYIPPTPAPAETENATADAGKSLQNDLRVRITAAVSESGLEDSQNWVGLHTDASVGSDNLDVLEAPPFSDHIRLSIVEDGKRYAINYKPFEPAGATWALQLTASDPSIIRDDPAVVLDFEAEGAGGEDLKIAVIDEDYGFARRVDQNQTSISWESGLTERNLTLVVGDAAFVDARLENLPVAPAETTLDQNFPNPFHRSTHIGYQLSDRSTVTLKIYNLLGQEIANLVHTTQNPGRYDVSWDGLDAAGRPAPSGVYIYRLQAGAFSASGKMALVR